MPAPSDSYDVAQSWRNCGLAITISAPGYHGAIGLKRQTLVATACHSDHAVETGGDVDLTVIIQSPSYDRPIRPDGQAMVIASPDCHCIGQVWWDVGLALGV